EEGRELFARTASVDGLRLGEWCFTAPSRWDRIYERNALAGVENLILIAWRGSTIARLGGEREH
ncbi:MAG TPA: hypothetical protein VMF30_00315, partial [Pirellulales bacterium]|nr:hypothetical protein [Pirellulales bacterium]